MPGSSWMTICLIIVCYLGLATTQCPEVDRVGAAVNILKNFGDLDLEFRIAPRNDTEPWLFHSDPIFVLKHIDAQRMTYESGFGQFRIEMCRGKNELLDSFFRDVSIEGVEQPWKAISRGWSFSKVPRTMGVASPLSHENGYVLLKLDLSKDEVFMKNQEIELSDSAKELFDKIVVNDTKSVLEFQKKFGTHYINSYTTGKSIFQVLTYRMNSFEYLGRLMYSEGISNMTFARLSKFLSPVFAKEIGQVMVTGANFNATVRANEILSLKNSKDGSRFPSLCSLAWKPWLLDQLISLGSHAITSLDLKWCDRALSEPRDKKEWFREVTQNLVQLNEEHA